MARNTGGPVRRGWDDVPPEVVARAKALGADLPKRRAPEKGASVLFLAVVVLTFLALGIAAWVALHAS